MYIHTPSKEGNYTCTRSVPQHDVTVCEAHVKEAQWREEEHQKGVNVEDSDVLPVFSVV